MSEVPDFAKMRGAALIEWTQDRLLAEGAHVETLIDAIEVPNSRLLDAMAFAAAADALLFVLTKARTAKQVPSWIEEFADQMRAGYLTHRLFAALQGGGENGDASQ